MNNYDKNMATKFIGIKEFRNNVSKFVKSGEERIIVLNRNTPVFEVRPIPKGENNLENFMIKIEKGLEDKKAGRLYSQKEVEKMVGL